jgi:acetone carboxylase gamma subunit
VDESEIRKDLKNLDIKKGFNEKDYKINNIQPEIDYTNNFDIKMAQTIWICRKCKKKNVERKCECGEKKEN